MATPTARFARPSSMLPPSASVHPLRRPRADAPRGIEHGGTDLGRIDLARDRTGRTDAQASRRNPAWLTDLTAEIDRCIAAIERVLARVGTLREDNAQLRAVGATLRTSLESERGESGRRILEQGQSMAREKRRTADAERNADALAGMLCDLERQLSVLRGDAHTHDARDVAPTPGRSISPSRRAG